MIITPSLKQGSFAISIGWEEAQGRRERRRTVSGEGAAREGEMERGRDVWDLGRKAMVRLCRLATQY